MIEDNMHFVGFSERSQRKDGHSARPVESGAGLLLVFLRQF